MASVKTAISIDEDLFARVDAVAEEMAVSRSRLISLSLEEYLRRRESRRLLEAINQSYGTDAAAEDGEIARALRGSQRRVGEGRG
jgi:metal-responsive CopG/Arc/MetJ family transcriptional regulator